MLPGNAPVQPTDYAAYSARLLALDAIAHETPRMKLLAWVMSLPDGIDPAHAAKAALDQLAAQAALNQLAAKAVLGSPAPGLSQGLSQPLLALVEIVAEYPLTRLAALRRGGRA